MRRSKSSFPSKGILHQMWQKQIFKKSAFFLLSYWQFSALEVEWVWTWARRPRPNLRLALNKPQFSETLLVGSSSNFSVFISEKEMLEAGWMDTLTSSSSSRRDIQSSSLARAQKDWACSTSTMLFVFAVLLLNKFWKIEFVRQELISPKL